MRHTMKSLLLALVLILISSETVFAESLLQKYCPNGKVSGRQYIPIKPNPYGLDGQCIDFSSDFIFVVVQYWSKTEALIRPITGKGLFLYVSGPQGIQLDAYGHVRGLGEYVGAQQYTTIMNAIEIVPAFADLSNFTTGATVK